MKKWLEKTRDAWNAMLDKIPRKTQVVLNLFLILIFGLALYIFLDAPAFSLEHAFRRAEKRHMVGPSQILGVEQLETSYADQLVVAKTENGVILYADTSTLGDFGFTYREKEQELMLCVTPVFLSSIRPPDGDDLTVILFDDYPDAVRAELDLETFWEDNQTGKQYRYQYSLSGQRTNPGYIRLDMDVNWHDWQGVWDHPENAAIRQLGHYAVNSHVEVPAGEFPARVRLYDEAGRLICAKDTFLFPQEQPDLVNPSILSGRSLS